VDRTHSFLEQRTGEERKVLVLSCCPYLYFQGNSGWEGGRERRDAGRGRRGEESGKGGRVNGGEGGGFLSRSVRKKRDPFITPPCPAFSDGEIERMEGDGEG
jgi:hypothetical protein